MAYREPVSTTSIASGDVPGSAWAQVRERLELGNPPPAHAHWVATVEPDGRPHVMPVWAVWSDDSVYFVSGHSTRKARNLAENAGCAIATAIPGHDVVIEGDARKVSDETTLQRVAAAWAAQGWPAEVDGGGLSSPYGAPSAPPPPWDVYEVRPVTAFGLDTDEPFGATRWRFET